MARRVPPSHGPASQPRLYQCCCGDRTSKDRLYRCPGALDEHGTLIGKGDVGAQVGQALKNVQAALAAAGAGVEHLIKWTIYLAQGQPLQPGVAAFQRLWGDRPNA